MANKESVKEKFLRYIELHPGCRRRDLPGWGADRVSAMSAITELESEGKVYSTRYDDRANMESYYKYYANS